MIATNSQAMDELFRSHEKDEAREAEVDQATATRIRHALDAWENFRRTTLQREVDAFMHQVTQSGGRANQVGGSKNSVCVELFSLFDRGIASGAALTFEVHPTERTISAEISVGGRQGRCENVLASDAAQEWVLRWFGFLMTDFRKNAR